MNTIYEYNEVEDENRAKHERYSKNISKLKEVKVVARIRGTRGY